MSDCKTRSLVISLLINVVLLLPYVLDPQSVSVTPPGTARTTNTVKKEPTQQRNPPTPSSASPPKLTPNPSPSFTSPAQETVKETDTNAITTDERNIPPTTEISHGTDSSTDNYEDDDFTLYIEMHNPAGLGNNLLQLTGVLALARVAGRDRRVALWGATVYWRDFWQSDGRSVVTLKESPTKSLPVAAGKTVKSCTLQALTDTRSDCHDAFWNRVNTTVISLSTRGSNHGTPMTIMQANDPHFTEAYLSLLQRDHDVDDRFLAHIRDSLSKKPAPRFIAMQLPMVTELGKVWHRTTLAFQELVDDFLRERQLTALSLPNNNDDEDTSWDRAYYFDAALHVRLCVDCGFTMKPETIKANIRCALGEMERSFDAMKSDQTTERSSDNATRPWEGKRIFLTSDARRVLPWVEELVPAGARLFHNLPDKMIHSARTAQASFQVRAQPFMDSWFLLHSHLLASCWTSFGQIGGLWRNHSAATIRPVTLEPFDRIIHWEHLPKWSYKESCLPLSSILLDSR